MLRGCSASRDLCQTASPALPQRSTKQLPTAPPVPGDDVLPREVGQQLAPLTMGTAQGTRPGTIPGQSRGEPGSAAIPTAQRPGSRGREQRLALHTPQSQNKPALAALLAGGCGGSCGTWVRKYRKRDISAEGSIALGDTGWICTPWDSPVSPAEQLHPSSQPQNTQEITQVTPRHGQAEPLGYCLVLSIFLLRYLNRKGTKALTLVVKNENSTNTSEVLPLKGDQTQTGL